MQNFNKQVAGLAIELFNNCEVYNIAKAHFEGKAEFKELRLAVCQNACLFSIYRISNTGNYSTMQLYTVIAKAILAAIKKRVTNSYYVNEAIFNYVEGLNTKPLVNVALYAIESYLNRYKGATSEQLGLLFEQCQALPSLKAVKKYLKQTGLFNGYMPINEA